MNETKLKQSLRKKKRNWSLTGKYQISFVFFVGFVATLFVFAAFFFLDHCPFCLLSLFFFLVFLFLNCSSPLSPLFLLIIVLLHDFAVVLFLHSFTIIIFLLLHRQCSFTSFLMLFSFIAVVHRLHCSFPLKRLQRTMRDSSIYLNLKERMEE